MSTQHLQMATLVSRNGFNLANRINESDLHTTYIKEKLKIDSLNSSIKSILILGAVILSLFAYHWYSICDCKKRISYSEVNLNDGIDLTGIFEPVDAKYLATIKNEWRTNGVNTDSFKIEAQYNHSPGRKISIIKHFSNGEQHYGGLIFPKNFDGNKKYPLMVWAEGLNQADPSVNLQNSTIKKMISRSSDSFLLIPSYRGQALVARQIRYCSDGFFGDAYDGATDDAIRLLELVKKDVKGIDKSRVSVIGVSRGGTVALLMGARDSTIRCIVSIAGPTNFHTKKAYDRYRKQYKYQFLSTSKSLKDIREKMVKSSPFYFIEDFPNALLLIHGKNDQVVNIAHASSVIEKLSGNENFEFILTENGHEFYNWNMVFSWVEEHN